ncbi:phage baseplate assembly protein V [Sphingomonas sp. SUN039]|uniref:phage baseplate assembly protein V n=1 Tax=Sphingomonas sp. SUN039 TaxID=2937787 RepID=UPI002164C9A9|nr:phage baseplate assembly protein V [Sphingomonas sp. SUN039]UVO55695.1 phage baseplate assembly protein V [Sphingomonas sp. SUN039]
MMEEECPKFFGKYRGTVEAVIDPLGLGRVQVSVPDVLGDGTSAWAWPCLPGAGPNQGFFMIPPAKANVWVEFERGDPDSPIWSGGFWGPGEAPAMIGPTQQITRVWAGKNFRIEVLDLDGAPTLEISLDTAMGKAEIKAGAEGMEIKAGASSVKLAIDGVSINGTNLKVLP